MLVDPKEIRRTILTMCYRSNMAHLGCSLSVVEMLLAIYQSVDIDKIKTNAPDRDRIYLSKGHCASAAYATLAAFGVIEAHELETYAQNGSRLAGLVSHSVPGVELSTGALGHGINVAVGCALGMRRKGYQGRVFVICGDGELEEGAIWEAIWFAAFHKLKNLYILVDNNRIGSVTKTERVANTPRMIAALKILGCILETVDGHSIPDIAAVIAKQYIGNLPRIIECQTVKGEGISFMQEIPAYHYRPLTDETYAAAMEELS